MKQQKTTTQTPYIKPTNTVKPYCKVCFDAGKTEEEYSSHWVKDKERKVVCPYLLSLYCRYCSNKGHTSKFCQLLNKTETETQVVVVEEVKEKVKEVTIAKGRFSLLNIDDDDEDEEDEEDDFTPKSPNYPPPPRPTTLQIAPMLPNVSMLPNESILPIAPMLPNESILAILPIAPTLQEPKVSFVNSKDDFPVLKSLQKNTVLDKVDTKESYADKLKKILQLEPTPRPTPTPTLTQEKVEVVAVDKKIQVIVDIPHIKAPKRKLNWAHYDSDNDSDFDSDCDIYSE
jgi:hypothetical protein